MTRRTLLAAGLVLLAACTAGPRAPDAIGSPRYLALGDSYTSGEGIDPRDSLPAQLARRLGTAPPDVIARTGWTTAELVRPARARQAGDPYRLVTLLIGANDAYRNRHETQFDESFGHDLALAIWHAGGHASRVVVIGIPDYTVAPAMGPGHEREAEQLVKLSEIARIHAELRGARFVSITEISRRAADDRGLVARDGLHPSAAMIRLWVDAIEPVARAALE